MTAKHTQGPWKVDEASDLPWAVIEDTEDGFGVCEITPHENAKERARLIAAAPELLEALERIASAEPMDGDSFVCDFDTLQSVARAALAKARGGA